MKIGVLSDTHIPERAKRIPAELQTIFAGVELIIHAGDLTTLSVIEELKTIAPVTAVCGNMDGPEIRGVLNKKEVFTAGKFTIGIFHGKGAPTRIVETVRECFNQKLDIIIFGHSHTPMNELRDGVLFFNPGSATDTVFAPYRSVGILTINDEIKGQIIKLS